MKKKTKKILLLFLTILLVFMPFKKSNAHSVELDPESLISMPYMLFGGSGTITIKNTVTDYTLYYQAVQISNTVFSEMEKTKENGEKELDTLEEELNALKAELDELKEIYDTASDAYRDGLQNTDLSETELEALKADYETARTNYQNKQTEYSNKSKEYSNKSAEIKAKIIELTPSYVENNWIQTTEDKISLDLSQFSGQEHFVVWAKLSTADGTYYDETIYTMTGTKPEKVDVTGVSLNKTTLSIEVDSSEKLYATITPSDATDKTLEWSSDNENVAIVSEDGMVTAKSVGIANITVTTNDGYYTATCKVTIIEEAPTTPEKTEDTSTAKGTLPQTGASNIIILIIVGIAILGIVCYSKYRYLNIK